MEMDLLVHLRVVFTDVTYTDRTLPAIVRPHDLESKSKATSGLNSFAFDNKFKE